MSASLSFSSRAKTHAKAAPGGGGKIEQRPGGSAGEVLLGLGQGAGEISPPAKQLMIKLLQFQALRGVKPARRKPMMFKPARRLAPRAMAKGGKSLLMLAPPCIRASVPTRMN